MNQIKVIALSGYKGSGKDSAADFMVREYQAIKHSFASNLKDNVAQAYGIPRNLLDDFELKEQPLLQYPVITRDLFSAVIHDFLKAEFKEIDGQKYWTPRALAILEGSIKRSVNTRYWVESVVKLIKGLNATCALHVISDMRYRSEKEQLKEVFGETLITVRVDRFDSIESSDPSERDLENTPHDYILNSRGTLEELYTTTKSLMAAITNNNKRLEVQC